MRAVDEDRRDARDASDHHRWIEQTTKSTDEAAGVIRCILYGDGRITSAMAATLSEPAVSVRRERDRCYIRLSI